VGYSLWTIARNIDTRILIVSATSFQAEGFLRRIRSHIETDPVFKETFGLIPAHPWTANELGLERKRVAVEPTLTALGVGGAIIGRHYDMIICDDIIDQDNSSTNESRRRLKEWFGAVLIPCLEPTGAIHVVGTRWHTEDLYGDILKSSPPSHGGI
jgi:hypothetical protein